MEWFVRDIKLSVRRARKEPALTTVVVLTLGLALGSSTAILGVVNATFFAPLPIPDFGRVMRLYSTYRKSDGSLSQVTVRGREFNVLARTVAEGGPFAGLVGLEDAQVTLTGNEIPQRVTLIRCTPGWLDTMGTRPVTGRWSTAEEESRGDSSGVAVIAHDLAALRFGGEAPALGRALTLDGRMYSIVGVMPAGFRFPYDAEVWTPVTTPWDLTHDYAVFGRLKPGVTPESAQAALDAAARSVRAQFPDTAVGFEFSQTTLMDNLLDNRQGAALALAGVAGFFLLLASANVANLLLARSASRRHEEAIRAALGASQWHLIRSTLVEAIGLAAAGACAGWLLATWLGGWLGSLVPSNFTRQLGILPDSANAHVILATAALGLLSGILAGLLPALHRARPDSGLSLHRSQRTGRSRRERLIMDGFVVAQFVLALALLSGAGFMMRNFARLAHRDLGIDASRLFAMQVSVTAPRYAGAEAKRALVSDILRETESTPGVVSAGVTTVNPLGEASWWAPVVAEGQEAVSEASTALVNHRLITPELCRTMGIPLVSGRYFTALDDENSPPVALVSARMANKFFPGRDALGKRVRLNRAGSPWLTVVGVVGDVLDARDPEAPRETWYLPYSQFSESPAAASVYLMVRAEGDPRGVRGGVAKAVWRVDKDLAVFNGASMDEVYRESLQQERLSVVLIVTLAAFGLLLGALGIYGALSLAAGERVREIGIRMALGATPARVQRMLLAHGLYMSLTGAALGLGAAWVMGRLLASQISLVGSEDPLVMAAAAGVLLLTALLAIYIPARRAAGVHPMTALKQE